MAELNTGPGDDHLLEGYTTSRMTHGHLKSHPNFHHLDRHDRRRREQLVLFPVRIDQTVMISDEPWATAQR